MADDIAVILRLQALDMASPTIARVSSEMEAMNVKAKAANEGVAVSSGKASTAVSSFGSNAQAAVRGVSTLGLVVGAAGLALDGFSAKASSTFSASMELIRTQAGATQHEVDSLRPAILAMSTDVATGPNELAASLFHVESAGIREAKALDLVRIAAEGAKVGHADLESVTNALIAITESRISGVKSETDAMGQLNAIVGAGNMRMQDLTNAMSTGILPVAKAVGLSLRDVGAALAVFTTQGVPAEEAATRLRMTLMLMEAPKKQAVDALKSIGIAQTQLADDMRNKGLTAALADLSNHLKDTGKTAVEQNQIISAAFGGGKSASGIITLLQNLDMLGSKFTDIGKNAHNFAADWAATQKEIDFQFAQFQATVERVAVSIGDTLVPEVRVLGNGLQDAALGLDALNSKAPGLITALSAIGISIGAISLGLKAGMALWAPYSAILAAIGTEGGETAIGASAAAGGIAETGAAATTAIPALVAYGETLDLAGVGALEFGTDLAAVVPELGAMDVGMGGMLLTAAGGPLILGALAAAIGVIAYEKSPAFRAEVDKLVTRVGTDLRGASYAASHGLDDLGLTMDSIGSKADSLGVHIGALGNKTDLLGGAIKSALLGPIPTLLDSVLSNEAAAHDKAAAAAARQTAALRELKKGAEALYQGLSSLQGPNFGGLLQSGPGVAGPGGTGSTSPLKKPVDDLAKDLDKLHQALQNAVNEAVARKYFDVQRGAPASVIASDDAAIKLAKKNLDDFNKAISTSSDSHKKHVKVIDSLTADLEKIRGRLTKALSDAVAQLVLDERKKGTPQSVLNADQSRVDAAKRSLDAFTRQVDDATRSVKESKGLPIQKQDQSQAQKNYDAALKQGAKDIREHGSMTVLDKERLLDSKNALDGFTDSTKKAANWVDQQTHPKTPPDALQRQNTARTKLQHDYDEAVAKGAADLRAGIPITAAHQAAIDKDKAALDRFDKSINDAQQSTDKASQAVLTFADILKQAGDDFAAAVDTYAKGLYQGTSGEAIPGAGKTVDDNGNIVRSTVTRGQKAEGDIYAAAAKKERADLDNAAAARVATDALIQAAKAAGDLSGEFDLLKKKADTDLGEANAKIAGYFYNNPNATTLPPDLQAAYAAAKAEGTNTTNAEIKGDLATGQYGAARQLQLNRDQQAYDDLIAKDIPILEAHGQLTQADISALQAHRQSTDADTQANWDLSYAAASAAEKQNMLAQRFSGMVSQAQQQQGDLQKLDQASLSILQANSTIQVDRLSELVTETQDQTSIMQAQTEVMKAAGEGQVASVNDATSILQAQESVWKDTQDLMRATTPQAIAIARQQLVVDQLGVKIQQDKARADATNAGYQVLLARDNVTIQRDKAAADRDAAAAKQVQDQDALQTAIDTQKLTEDEVKLSGIMAQDIDVLTSAFVDVQDRGAEIQGILDQIAGDNQTIAADNRQSAMDQITASQQAQADSLTIANDEQRLSSDQASASASTLQGQMQIAQDTYSLEQAKFSLQQLQYQQQLKDSTATSDYYKQMFDLMQRTLGFFTTGAFTARYGGTGGRFLNQFSTDYAMQSHATVLA